MDGMQTESTAYERQGVAGRQPRPALRRFVWGYVLLLALLLVALAVPLINVNRFQRRIVRSLSESIGRPIHLDRISLTLLPLPGLTIENLVVSEDPAFGDEPFARASEVRATLRVSSLWRRRLEFSRISFTDPSMNLVRNTGGKWNLEGILLQAARIDAAPTGQARPSLAPRFPYIEAVGARLNLKKGLEKTPVSLTEADVALWLHAPGEWRLRLRGRPVRTDMSVTETGSFQMEGTLGRAASLAVVPIDLKASWRNVPLGEASRMALGRDAGLRGTLTLSASAQGTIEQSAVQVMVHLVDGRRAEFVPARSLNVDAECLATATGSFHAFTDLRCGWPPALSDGQKTMALTATVPDVRQPATASFQLGTPGIPAATLLDWLRIASPRIGPDVTATGSLTGSLSRSAGPDAGESAGWTGEFALAQGALSIPSVSSEPVFQGEATVRSSPVAGEPLRFVLAPLELALGGKDAATLDGHFERSGYMLHLSGMAAPKKLLALGAALPQLGDGLADALPAELDIPARFDLTATHAWNGQRLWHPTESTPQRRPVGRRTRR